MYLTKVVKVHVTNCSNFYSIQEVEGKVKDRVLSKWMGNYDHSLLGASISIHHMHTCMHIYSYLFLTQVLGQSQGCSLVFVVQTQKKNQLLYSSQTGTCPEGISLESFHSHLCYQHLYCSLLQLQAVSCSMADRVWFATVEI